MRFFPTAFALAFTLTSSGFSQTTIPLINDAADGRLGISVELGTDTNSFNYLLDTGSFIFTTALGTNSYWDGAITGSIDTNTPFVDSYASFDYQGDAATTTVTLGGSTTNPLVVSDVQIGVITNVTVQEDHSTNFVTDTNWEKFVNSTPPTPPAPVALTGGGGLWYGTFGVGLAQEGTIGGNLYTVLDQIPLTNGATTQGFIISSGGPGGNATLTVGLNQTTINSFPILVSMNTDNTQSPKLNPYGNTVVSANGVTNKLYPEAQLLATYSFTNNGVTYTTNAYEILDTGENGGQYNFGTNSAASVNPLIDSDSNITTGTIFTITNSPSSTNTAGFDWSRLAGTLPYVNQIKAGTNAHSYDTLNTGIDLFYQYNVMFDTQDGLVGFNPIAASLYVGTYGQGSATNITSGTNFFSQTFVGYGSTGSNNSLVVSGAGTVLTNANGLFAGESGSGNSMVISNGAVVTGYSAVVGDAPGASSNSLLVTGTNTQLITTYSDLDIGVAGSWNSMVISNGAVVTVNSIQNGTILGVASSSSNNSLLVTGAGSTLTNSFSLIIGDQGSGNTLVISNGGAVTVAGSTYVGYNNASWGNSIIVNGSNSILNVGGDLLIGDAVNSGNSLTITGGAKVTSGLSGYYGSGVGYTGDATSSNNSVLISGAGSSWTVSGNNGFWIGYGSSQSQVVISNGGLLSTVSGYIGGDKSSNNTVLITGSGSSWSNSATITIGGYYDTNYTKNNQGGSGTLSLGSGASLISDIVIIGSGSKTTGTLNVGTFGGSDTNVTLTASMVILGPGSGTLNFNQSDTATLTSAISGTGLVNQLGIGTTILTGSNSYAGTTLVSGGTLLANNTNGSAIGSSTLTVGSNGTLGGKGIIGGATTIQSGGYLTAGSGGSGTLTFTNSLTLSAGSTTTLTLKSPSDFTSIHLIGRPVTYGGALVFNITSYTPAAGDLFTLFNMTGGAGESGDFSSVVAGSLNFTDSNGIWSALDTGDNLEWQFANATGQLSVDAVPEPSTYALFGIGAGILLVVMRRRAS